MLDAKDLKKFARLPPAFNLSICRDIENAIDEYDIYRAYIARLLDRKGDMAFKNVETYLDVADDIRYENYPNEDKLIQVLGEMCSDYCDDDNLLKALNERKNSSWTERRLKRRE